MPPHWLWAANVPQAAVSSRSKRRLFDHLVGAGEEAVRDDQI